MHTPQNQMGADGFFYANVFLSGLNASALDQLMEFAPVPRASRGFVNTEAEVLISNAPHGAYIVADAHTDPCSGAVSFGSGTAGSSSEWLLHGPTSTFLNPGQARGVDALAKIPPSMRGAGGAGAHAFDAPEDFEDDQASGGRLSQACLRHRGDFLYVPEGYWHAVRSTGLRVCVHFMLSQGLAGGGA
mmetsp:Transcript_63538/g.175189  ORF Transcript_63538/g.175189 Transcript_63538/m.175189 type:complete len:188 (-) Transcript_63538:111-674(-)